MSRRTRRWLRIVTALAALPMLAAGKCEGVGDSPHGDPFPAPIETPKATGTKAPEPECDVNKVPSDKPNIGSKRYVTLYACVEKDFAPMEMHVYAHDYTTGEQHDLTEPIAGNKYQRVLGYDKGHHVVYEFELKPSRAGSKQGFMYISDGPANRKTYKIDGAWRAGPVSFTVAR